MKRRSFLKGLAGLTGLIAAPSLVTAKEEKNLSGTAIAKLFNDSEKSKIGTTIAELKKEYQNDYRVGDRVVFTNDNQQMSFVITKLNDKQATVYPGFKNISLDEINNITTR